MHFHLDSKVCGLYHLCSWTEGETPALGLKLNPKILKTTGNVSYKSQQFLFFCLHLDSSIRKTSPSDLSPGCIFEWQAQNLCAQMPKPHFCYVQCLQVHGELLHCPLYRSVLKLVKSFGSCPCFLMLFASVGF